MKEGPIRSRVTSRFASGGHAVRRGAVCMGLARARVTRAGGACAPLAIGVVAVLLLVVPALLLAGCGEEAAIVTQELVIDEPLGSAAVTDVKIDMGAGKLALAPGVAGLVSGTVRYNRESWKPAITRSDKNLTIKQRGPRDLHVLGGEMINEWNLALGRAPMRLEVNAGTHEGTYELGGLTLQKLVIKDGVSKTRGVFQRGQPRPDGESGVLDRGFVGGLDRPRQRQFQKYGVQRRSRRLLAGLLGGVAHLSDR